MRFLQFNNVRIKLHCVFKNQPNCCSVGQSADAGATTMVDSIKVYTKTKEAFSWPEDSDDSSDSAVNKSPPAASSAPSVDTTADSVAGSTVATPAPLTGTDR